MASQRGRVLHVTWLRVLECRPTPKTPHQLPPFNHSSPRTPGAAVEATMSSTLSTNDVLFNALLALSNNLQLKDARDDLLRTTRNEDLVKVVESGFQREFSRKHAERIAATFLDIIASEKEAEDANANAGKLRFGGEVKMEDDYEIVEGTSSSECIAMSGARDAAYPIIGQIPLSSAASVSSVSEPAPTAVVQSGGRLGKRTWKAQQYTSSKKQRTVGNVDPAPTARPPNTKRATQQPAIPTPDLELVLYVPHNDGSFDWQNLSGVADTLKDEITTKFRSDFLSVERHKEAYRRMLRSQEKYYAMFTCVNMTVRAGSASKPISWTEAGGDSMRSCDRCTAGQRLCVRLVKMDDVMKLAVYPLPEVLRTGKTWEELAFWV
jgi:hypothetical protein